LAIRTGCAQAFHATIAGPTGHVEHGSGPRYRCSLSVSVSVRSAGRRCMLQMPREQILGRLTADARTRQRWIDFFKLAVAVGLAYFLAARLSLHLLTRPGVAVFWPAAGISSGILIALGCHARWPVAVGTIAATFAANLLGDRTIWGSTYFALCDAGEA